MAEYIDRLSVYKEACMGCICHGDEIGSCFSSEPCEKLCFYFASAHAADVVSVVHGRWKNPHWENDNFCYNCSICGSEALHCGYKWADDGIYPICPNCGAKMDGER